jgi:hypothetical protein
MNRFQPFDFRTVGEMLDYLPEPELKITERLRALIFECIPDAKEKLSYNVPFYSRHTRIVFIWPGAIPWGKTSPGVQIGFCKGNLLSDPSYLDMGRRKQVYTKTFHSLKDINVQMLQQLLFEAVIIDEDEYKQKRIKGNKRI